MNQKNPYRLELTLLGLPSSPNSRRHWRVVAKENKRWYSLILFLVGSHKPPSPLKRAKLTLIRVSTAEPDFDNLVASMKVIVDGLRYARVLLDDKKVNVGAPEYRWERGRPRMGHVRVVVEEIVTEPKGTADALH